VTTKTYEPWTAFENLVSSTRMSSASIHFVFAASTWPCSLLARHAVRRALPGARRVDLGDCAVWYRRHLCDATRPPGG